MPSWHVGLQREALSDDIEWCENKVCKHGLTVYILTSTAVSAPLGVGKASVSSIRLPLQVYMTIKHEHLMATFTGSHDTLLYLDHVHEDAGQQDVTALVPVYLCLNSVWSALSNAPKSAPCDLGTGSPLAAASGSSYLDS